jgi:hypothetical protein
LEFTTQALDRLLNDDNDHESARHDEGVSGVLEGGQEFERFVEVVFDLVRWFVVPGKAYSAAPRRAR